MKQRKLWDINKSTLNHQISEFNSKKSIFFRYIPNLRELLREFPAIFHYNH
ncbi:hypothetical protein AAKU58_002057 [Oxalobacteraceae bacterium GrIS 1.18]